MADPVPHDPLPDRDLPTRADVQEVAREIRKLHRLLRWLVPGSVAALLLGGLVIFRLGTYGVTFLLLGGGLLLTGVAVLYFGAKVYTDFRNRDYKFRM